MGKPKGKRGKREQTYQPKQNAVNITIWDPSGQTIDPRAQQAFEQAALDVAAQHKLLMLIATE